MDVDTLTSLAFYYACVAEIDLNGDSIALVLMVLQNFYGLSHGRRRKHYASTIYLQLLLETNSSIIISMCHVIP